MSAPPPGVRERCFLGGVLMIAGPSDITPTVEYGWANHERDSEGYLGRDLPLWWTGLCLSPSKFTWALLFEDLYPADAELLSRVQSWGDTAFDFCPWVYHTESFRAAAGLLQRQDCLTGVPEGQRPVGAATKFAHYAYLDGSLSTVTLGAVDGSYRQAFSDGDGTLTEVRYCPVFRVILTAFQPRFQMAHREHCRIVLTEV